MCCVLQELDIIYKVPHCVPISAHHKWNFDDLLEMMWEYLRLVRMYVNPGNISRSFGDALKQIKSSFGQNTRKRFCLFSPMDSSPTISHNHL